MEGHGGKQSGERNPACRFASIIAANCGDLLADLQSMTVQK
jgi:hypothetical protein